MLLTTHPLIALRLQMGWNNTFVSHLCLAGLSWVTFTFTFTHTHTQVFWISSCCSICGWVCKVICFSVAVFPATGCMVYFTTDVIVSCGCWQALWNQSPMLCVVSVSSHILSTSFFVQKAKAYLQIYWCIADRVASLADILHWSGDVWLFTPYNWCSGCVRRAVRLSSFCKPH